MLKYDGTDIAQIDILRTLILKTVPLWLYLLLVPNRHLTIMSCSSTCVP